MSVGGKSGYSSGAAKRLIHTVLKLARVAQGQFEVGSVLAMSFHDASFDAALSFHVAMKAFGKPEGLLGRTGGYILAMGKGEASAWFIDLLNVSSHERALEVGFGRGLHCRAIAKGFRKAVG